MSQVPEVSVVIPAYNSAHSLSDAIDSVRMQRWPNLEIIVVDDGSTDQTDRVLTDLAGPDVHVIRQEENAGPAAARNAGIQAAHGKWIAFLDADDIWLPGKLKKQFQAICRNPDAAVVYSDGYVRHVDGQLRERRARRPRHSVLRELLWGSLFSMSSTMVRRNCFHAAGAFDVQLRTGEDWDIWLRLATSYRSVCVEEPLIVVAKHSETSQAEKYPCNLLEHCTLRVLNRFFGSAELQERHPEVAARRTQTYAWHCAVLAKSYLRRRHLPDYVRLAMRSMASHPLGLCYMAPTWCLPRVWLPASRG